MSFAFKNPSNPRSRRFCKAGEEEIASGPKSASVPWRSRLLKPIRVPGPAQGFTLAEILITVGVGSLVLSAVAMTFISCMRSFVGLGNYAQLTGQSRHSLDQMSRDIREATQIVAVQTNLPVRWLQLSNAFDGKIVTFTWDSTSGVLTRSKSGEASCTNLTSCSQWTFSLYQRTPTNNWNFYTATNLATCKLISMNWKCSRTFLGRKLNTEEVLTAQVVLRNKP